MFFSKDFSKNTIFASSIYLYLSHFADYILALFFLPFIAKTIGAIEFGKIGLAQSFGILIILIIEFGSSTMATRKVALIKADDKAMKKFIDELFTFKICLMPMAILLSFAAVIFIPAFRNEPIYLIIAVVGSIFHGISPSWYFQGIEKMKNIAMSKIIFRSIGFLFILLFVKSPGDSWIVLFSYAMTSFLVFTYLNIIIFKKYGVSKLVSSKRVIKVLIESLSAFFISIIPIIYQNLSLFLMSAFISPIQLGYYYGANRIYRAFNTLYGPISQAYFPALSSANSSNKTIFKSLLKKYFLLIIVIGLVFFMINYFLAEFIIFNFLGKDYGGAIEILKLFSIVLFLTALSNALGRQWIIGTNKDFYFLSIQSLSSIVSFIFFFFTFKNIGVKALPFSIIIFEIFTIFLCSIFLILNVKFSYFDK